MKKTLYEDFRLIELRPALNNHKEVIFDVEIDMGLCHVEINEARALEMEIGDTAQVYATVLFENKIKDCISVHIDGNVLSSYIEKFGIKGKTKFIGRFEHLYAVYSSDGNFVNDSEINTYKLLEIF